MRKVIGGALLIVVAAAIAAQPLLVKPRVYDPGQSGIIVSAWAPGIGVPAQTGDRADHGVVFQKNGPTSTNAAGFAIVAGVEGLSTSGLTLGFDYKQGLHCGAGAPRFNVVDTDGNYYFFGCSYGTHSTNTPVTGWNRVTFAGTDSFPTLPAGKTVAAIALVFDEGTDTPISGGVITPGSAIVDNIRVNAQVAGKPGAGPN